MDFAPIIAAKPSIFTRIYFSIGIIAFSLTPLAFALAFQGDDESRDVVDLEVLVLAIAVLQGMLWFAQRRCGTPERPYWRSLLVIASCFSTGWTYLNIIFVPAALVIAMSLSCALAFCEKRATTNVTVGLLVLRSPYAPVVTVLTVAHISADFH